MIPKKKNIYDTSTLHIVSYTMKMYQCTSCCVNNIMVIIQCTLYIV